MTHSTSGKRAKHTGKGKNHTFLLLNHNMMDSPAWLGLSGSAVKLLMEMARQFNGHNNGDISIPMKRMKSRGFNSSDVLNRAKDELLDAAFITRTRYGGLHQCSLYSLTWLPINECNGKLEVAAERVASHAWKESRAQSGLRSDSTKLAPDYGAIAA